ncbi:MAG: NAD(P)-binding protein [Deltaproteobacteria bacterium]|nr:NAD(P)-binding protein [Deltaproteobacteria bacterium]
MTKSMTKTLTNREEEATEPTEHCDALVIGANLGGLTISYLLACWGYSVRTIERAPFIGGIDRSFRNRNGRIFDFGVHSLDYMRSGYTTRLMMQAIDNQVIKMERKRGIVLRSCVIPYNADKSEWPAELAAMLPEGELVDELGTARPTRQNLARYYGEEFTDFIFDETLASYPADSRHLAFGVEEWELMKNIYPWFFPQPRSTRHASFTTKLAADRERISCIPWRGASGPLRTASRGRSKSAGARSLRAPATCTSPSTRSRATCDTSRRRDAGSRRPGSIGVRRPRRWASCSRRPVPR